MYSKTQWGGAVDPFILVALVKDDSPPDRTVSLIIFEYRDKNLLGKPIGDDPDEVCPRRGERHAVQQTAILGVSGAI
jgi:hypothetical protein